MSTHLPGFQSFFRFLHRFVLAKLAISSIRVKRMNRKGNLPLSVKAESALSCILLNSSPPSILKKNTNKHEDLLQPEGTANQSKNMI